METQAHFHFARRTAMVEFRTLGALRLIGTDGREAAGVLAQPKRLALLAYLIMARPRGQHRRDTLLALFWPDLSQSHARHALSQALHFLRRSLSAQLVVTRGSEEVGVDPTLVRCDALAFDQAVDAGDVEAASTLYEGDFLAGFFLSDAPEFERWLDNERSRLRSRAVEVARTRADLGRAEGKRIDAARWASRAAALDPLDERALRRLMRAHDEAGDRAAAIGAFQAFARRLSQELDAEPSPETLRLAEVIRARVTPSPLVSADNAPVRLERLPRERLAGREKSAPQDTYSRRVAAVGARALRSIATWVRRGWSRARAVLAE